MRLSALVLFLLVSVAPAAAQPAVCEKSVTGDAGEVIVDVDARGRAMVSWVVCWRWRHLHWAIKHTVLVRSQIVPPLKSPPLIRLLLMTTWKL